MISKTKKRKEGDEKMRFKEFLFIVGSIWGSSFVMLFSLIPFMSSIILENFVQLIKMIILGDSLLTGEVFFVVGIDRLIHRHKSS